MLMAVRFSWALVRLKLFSLMASLEARLEEVMVAIPKVLKVVCIYES